AYESAVELAVFGFPRDLLALPADTVRDLAAVPIAADQGAAALAAPLLRRVTLDLDSYQPASAARLCTGMMDLVTAAVAERAVGARWGLPDSAQFSRMFRRAYGLPPAEYRRCTQAQLAGAGAQDRAPLQLAD